MFNRLPTSPKSAFPRNYSYSSEGVSELLFFSLLHELLTQLRVATLPASSFHCSCQSICLTPILLSLGECENCGQSIGLIALQQYLVLTPVLTHSPSFYFSLFQVFVWSTMKFLCYLLLYFLSIGTGIDYYNSHGTMSIHEINPYLHILVLI